ncbi:hypothetical protein [Amycolatopsis albispora]|uniref:hypothetical protein n=1 Tax=Amycolatopsis albispora TaxID=1804986 RepID=UPI0013B465AA|nr:hypothetical protein [Amycolatopsis albispora]
MLHDPVERVRQHGRGWALGQLGEWFGHRPVLADADTQHPVPGVGVLGHETQVGHVGGHR